MLEKSFRTWGGLSTYHHHDPAMTCAQGWGTYLKDGGLMVLKQEKLTKLAPFREAALTR